MDAIYQELLSANPEVKLVLELLEVRDREGRVVKYEYDDYGNIKKQINSDNSYQTFVYDDAANLKEVIDEDNVKKTYEYKNNIIEKENIVIAKDNTGKEEVATTSYKADNSKKIKGLIAEKTNPDGKSKVAYDYDSYGYLKSEKDEVGNTKNITYSPQGLKIEEFIEPGILGGSTLKTIYNYNKAGNLINTILNGVETTTIIYDDYGRVKSEKDANESKADGYYKKLKYNARGLVEWQYEKKYKESVDLYEAKKYIYDGKGQLITEAIGVDFVQLDKEPQKWIKNNTIYYDNGKIKEENNSEEYKEIGDEGKKVVFEYDKEGNVTSEITQAQKGNTVKKSWEYEYPKNDTSVLYKVKEIMEVKKLDLGTSESNELGNTKINKTSKFDFNGNIISETTYEDSLGGKRVAYKYDEFNNVVEESILVGKGEDKDYAVKSTTTKVYNKDNKLIKEVDDKGIIVNYGYDKRANVVSKTGAEVSYYGYDLANRVTWEASDLDLNVAIQDLSKSYSQITGLENYKSIFDLNSDGIIDLFDMVTVSSGNVKLNKTNFYYDNVNNLIAKEKEYANWDTNEIVKELIAGYKYDSEGKVIKEVDGEALKNVEGKLLKDKINNAYGLEYIYDYQGELISEKRPEDKVAITYSYDNTLSKSDHINVGRTKIENNEKGSYKTIFDVYGNILEKQAIENSKIVILEVNTYDYLGNMLTHKDANNNISTYEYNNLGKIRTEKLPGDKTVAANTLTYRYNPYGEEVFSKDDFNKMFVYERDYKGRILTETGKSLKNISAANEKVNIVKTYNYVTDKSGYTTVTEVDGNGNKKIKSYDSLDRLVKETVAVTNGSDKKDLVTETSYLADDLVSKTIDQYSNVWENKYDVFGRLTEKKDGNGEIIEKLEYYSNGNQKTSIDALNNTKSFKYDKNNRLIETIDAEGKSNKQKYDSQDNIILKVDALGNESHQSYDLRNRLKTVEIKGDAASVTSYEYDENDNLIKVIGGENRVKEHVYNCRNIVINSSEVNGETKYTDSFSYYPNGELKQKIDKNENILDYKIDALGREIEVVTHLKDNKKDEVDKIKTIYDNNNNEVEVTNSRNKVIIDTIVRDYDELNRVIKKENFGKNKNDKRATLYTYDGKDNENYGYHYETTVFDNKETKKIFDKSGRVVKSIDNGNITSFEYYPNGNKKSMVYENSKVSEEYVYNKNNFLVNLINKKGEEILSEYKYSYNDNNKIDFKEDSKGKTSYLYDSANRLKEVKEPNKNTTYKYDKAGNRILETIEEAGVKYTLDYKYNGFNRLESVKTIEGKDLLIGSKSYVYDNNGNVKSEVVDNKKIVESTEVVVDPKELLENRTNLVENKKVEELATNKVESKTLTYEYDIFNNMVEAKEASGKIVLSNEYNRIKNLDFNTSL